MNAANRTNRIVAGAAVLCLLSAVCLARGGGGGRGGFGGGGERGGFGDAGRGWGGRGDSFGGSVRYSDVGRTQGVRTMNTAREMERTTTRTRIGGGDFTDRQPVRTVGEQQRTTNRTRTGGNDFTGQRSVRTSQTLSQPRTVTPTRVYSQPQQTRDRIDRSRNFSVPPSNIGSVRYRDLSRPATVDRSFDRTTRRTTEDRRIDSRVSPSSRIDSRHDGGRDRNPSYRPVPRPWPDHHPHPGPGWHYPAPYWRPYHYNGWNYWCWNNHWYRPYYYCGSVWYFSVSAPIGIYIDTLPAVGDYQVVVIDGRTYYIINGDYYVQTVQNGQTVYVCAERPSQSAAPQVIKTQDYSDAPNPFDVMDNMSNFLSMQDTFTVSVEDTFDEPSTSGSVVQRSSNRTVYVGRPSQLAILYEGDDGNSRLLYNGVSLYSINMTTDVFSSAPMPSTIDGMLDTMSQKYGINLPLSDFLYSNPGQAMLSDVRSGQYVGMSIINGVTCNHLAFTGDTVDWEIWIQTGKQPLPMKLVITYKNEEGKPRYTMNVNQWKLGSVPAGAFNLNIPSNARQVEMLPIQTVNDSTSSATAAASTTTTQPSTLPTTLPGPPPAGAVPVK